MPKGETSRPDNRAIRGSGSLRGVNRDVAANQRRKNAEDEQSDVRVLRRAMEARNDRRADKSRRVSSEGRGRAAAQTEIQARRIRGYAKGGMATKKGYACGGMAKKGKK